MPLLKELRLGLAGSRREQAPGMKGPRPPLQGSYRFLARIADGVRVPQPPSTGGCVPQAPDDRGRPVGHVCPNPVYWGMCATSLRWPRLPARPRSCGSDGDRRLDPRTARGTGRTVVVWGDGPRDTWGGAMRGARGARAGGWGEAGGAGTQGVRGRRGAG